MKERCFYLDFVRALAVILILMTHYNANYIYMGTEEALNKAVVSTKIANIYIGDFGVALFLIISGAALMYTYEKKLDIKQFYQKRFMSIYPMFWIGYFICFAHYFIVHGGIYRDFPRWRILLTFFGMDGYLGIIFPNFYLIGEWFLGFIILAYIIFPVLRKGVNEHPVITLIAGMSIYFYFILDYNIPFTKNIFFFIRIIEIIFGMYFMKYIKKVNTISALIALLILIINSIMQPNIDASFQMTYIGISAFLVLVYLSEFFKKSILVKRMCQILSKYSYAIFLTHHYIFSCFVSKVDLNQLSVFESYVFFIILCCIVGIFSKLLYEIHSYIIEKTKKYYNLIKNKQG